MTAHTSNNPAARIGKLKGDILKHAMPAEVLGITGQQRMMPKNQSKTISHRMYLPYGAASTNWDTRNRPVADAVATPAAAPVAFLPAASESVAVASPSASRNDLMPPGLCGITQVYLLV